MKSKDKYIFYFLYILKIEIKKKEITKVNDGIDGDRNSSTN
jgi:hypothetical protein